MQNRSLNKTIGCPTSGEALQDLKNHGCKQSELHIYYEASGCGFWIPRRLLQRGWRSDGMAPWLTPT